MGKASRRPLEFDTSVPNIARMYDYWLSGRQAPAPDRDPQQAKLFFFSNAGPARCPRQMRRGADGACDVGRDQPCLA